MATSPAARLPAIAAALPPPGTGSAEARRSTKATTVRSPKRVLGSTPPIVGTGLHAVASRCAARARRVLARADTRTRHAEPEGPDRGVVRWAEWRAGRAWWLARPAAGPHEVDGEEPRPRAVVDARSRGPREVVQPVDRPALRPVLVRQGEPGGRRVDLEQRSGPGDRRVGGPLVSDGDEPRDL